MSDESIEQLKSRITELETKNAALQNENTKLKIEFYSENLIECISSGLIPRFKTLLNEINYPLNSFFSENSSEKGHTLLTFSTVKNQFELIKFLLEEKQADINKANKKDGWTALMYAVESKNYELVNYFLQKNANVNIVDEDGFNAVAIAIDTHNEEMVKLLLDKKPQVNNKEVVVSLLEMSENENIKKMIRNYYGVEITEEEETQNEAD